MGISRYEIRNEYRLGDEEMYKGGDCKDDPEALLEGVAMAGLVGLLRQLGDLSQFASEVFHNLHDEVMVTAARGHGLRVRVQQLETDVHFIEKSFLSTTDQSSFFYNAGVDWHRKVRIDQNLLTQGDLPRFLMHSYEECREPPRLFLLDKFDVAGTGACLKRYSDPSLFKVETIGMTADVQREKKIRKAKKKGSLWRNGENADVLPKSHAKLHQLFLEERVENVSSNTSHRAKLRRRLNGFPFDSKSGNNYMKKLVNSPSPDQKVLHEMTEKLSPPLMPAVNNRESSMDTKSSPSSSPDREEVMMLPPVSDPNEVPADDINYDRPNPSIAKDGTRFALDEAVDAESKREDSLNGYQSDDFTSEKDSYVDAPSTIESELDTDSDLKLKSDFARNNQQLICYANQDHMPTKSSDSDSTISNGVNNSSGKEISSSSSLDSPSTSAENPQPEIISPETSPSADIPENELVDLSSESTASEYTRSNTAAITNYRSDSFLTFRFYSGEVVGKDRLSGPESDEMTSTLVMEENKTNLVIDSLSSPSISNPKSLLGDDSPRSSAGEDLMDDRNVENVPCVSTVSHTMDSSVAISADMHHEDQPDCEDHDLDENIPSVSSTSVVLSQNGNCTPETTESLIPGELEDEAPEMPENIPSEYPDIAHSGDIIESTISKGENLVVELDNEDSNVFVVSPKCAPSIMEASSERKLEEISSASDAEENLSNSSIDNQIDSEINLSNLAGSSDRHPADVDAHYRDVTPEEETAAISETVDNDGISLSTNPSGIEITEMYVSADLQSVNEVHIWSDDSDSETGKAKSAHMAKSENVGLPMDCNKLEVEQIPCFDEHENDKNCLSDTESGLVEAVGQTEGLDTVICNTTSNDNPKSEVSDTVLSQRHVSGPPLPIEYDIEESVPQEQIELPQSPDSSFISSELSPPEPISQQTLHHDDHKDDNDSASMLSLVNYINPPSASSDLQSLSNSNIDASENPKDSLGANFPPMTFSATNQINVDNLPPLPLPPVQWIMGKVQDASSTTEVETTKPEEFPREIPPPTTSTSDVSSSLQEVNQPLTQIPLEATSKKEVVESSSSSLEATAMHGKIDLPPKIVNIQHQFVRPTSESESTSSAAEEDGASIGTRPIKLPLPRNPLIESVASIDKSRLRKVSERVIPELRKLDEKDSFLEQIRNRSFNLKPAVTTRPSFRGPQTNRNVAAILEKANSIRQAFAGNDDDDEDSWSD